MSGCFVTPAVDMISAITMARRLYAYDLTTAKQFVEALVRKQAESRSSVNFNDH